MFKAPPRFAVHVSIGMFPEFWQTGLDHSIDVPQTFNTLARKLDNQANRIESQDVHSLPRCYSISDLVGQTSECERNPDSPLTLSNQSGPCLNRAETSTRDRVTPNADYLRKNGYTGVFIHINLTLKPITISRYLKLHLKHIAFKNNALHLCWIYARTLTCFVKKK